eukprot:5606474-Prymnesium_polylepis.4
MQCILMRADVALLGTCKRVRRMDTHLLQGDIAAIVPVEEPECLTDHLVWVFEFVQIAQLVGDVLEVRLSERVHSIEVHLARDNEQSSSQERDQEGVVPHLKAAEQKRRDDDHIESWQAERTDFIDRPGSILVSELHHLVHCPRFQDRRRDDEGLAQLKNVGPHEGRRVETRASLSKCAVPEVAPYPGISSRWFGV